MLSNRPSRCFSLYFKRKYPRPVWIRVTTLFSMFSSQIFHSRRIQHDCSVLRVIPCRSTRLLLLLTAVLSIIFSYCDAYVHPFVMKRPSMPSLVKFDKATNLVLTAAAEDQSAGQASDEKEWKALLAAFQLYKAAYGDLKIPQRFVVPNMKPWPKAAWGMKLGKQVAAMRSTGKFLQNQPARRQLLEDMGFAWRVRKSTPQEATTSLVPLEQIYKALQVYRAVISKRGAVPSNFVVPDAAPWPERVRGLPLGSELASLAPRLTKNQIAKSKFESLGIFLPDDIAQKKQQEPQEQLNQQQHREEEDEEGLTANDVRFQKVYAALTAYKEIYGDLLVPQPFVVPDKSDQWPKETWGLRLGARVNAIRSQGTFVNTNPERKQMLDELGFVWSPPKSERRRGRKAKSESESTEDASISLQETTMDSLFDGSFDFGKEFSMSSVEGQNRLTPTWSLEGGRLEEVTRAAEEAAAAADEEYAPPRTLAESLEEATERAKEVGIIDGLTERKRVIKGKREKNIPWFNDDFGDEFVFDDIVEALTVYKSINGDFSNLTEEFVVPVPKEITGFLDEEPLERFDIDASARAAAAIANLEKKGDVSGSESLIAAEIRRLQQEVGQVSTATETRLRKTENAAKWPEHLGGMKLGNIVRRIRDGSLEVKHLPERKAQLDDIDFDWGDPRYFMDIPFEKAMCAMYAYYLVRGDMFVYEDFIMPDEDPWPQALAGYEIGKAVKRIRELQNALEAYHPEKVSLLRMIDFVWFPTMALPLDPNEPEMTPELLLLSAMGHPDYSKMIDIPMGLPDKIMADGPFYESDDPKDWWRKWHNWEYVKDYWYQQGRRDNAFALREMGYPMMADEHEAKYGPGLFKQMEATMLELDRGIEGLTLDEKRELVKKLSYFRQEMLGCSDIHPLDRDELLEKFDAYTKAILQDKNLDMSFYDELDSSSYDEQSTMQPAPSANDEEQDVYYEDDEEYDEVFDVEDELGLDKR